MSVPLPYLQNLVVTLIVDLLFVFLPFFNNFRALQTFTRQALSRGPPFFWITLEESPQKINYGWIEFSTFFFGQSFPNVFSVIHIFHFHFEGEKTQKELVGHNPQRIHVTSLVISFLLKTLIFDLGSHIS